MSLDYLRPYEKFVNLDKLLLVKLEREKWNEYANVSALVEKVKKLPQVETKHLSFSGPFVEIGKREEINDEAFAYIEELAKEFIPWRKGPFKLFDLEIDAEWRSDYKWERLEESLIPLKGKRVLDIGCNNGYYMFRMLQHKPELVLGIDPVPRLLQQFLFLNHFAKVPNLHFELFGYEQLHHFKNFFNVIFSMGVIYHCKNPIQHLQDIHDSLAPGGQLILETMAIPGDGDYALSPEERYAQMRNVWFVPTLKCLLNWVKRCHFEKIEVLSNVVLTPEEQRQTKWCPPPWQSLEQFLDANDRTKTVEGHPAPLRVCLSVRKKTS